MLDSLSWGLNIRKMTERGLEGERWFISVVNNKIWYDADGDTISEAVNKLMQRITFDIVSGTAELNREADAWEEIDNAGSETDK